MNPFSIPVGVGHVTTAVQNQKQSFINVVVLKDTLYTLKNA